MRRATQWVMRGVELRTVQELLGHSCITTTMRYAQFPSNHAIHSVRSLQATEGQEVGRLRATNGRQALAVSAPQTNAGISSLE